MSCGCSPGGEHGTGQYRERNSTGVSDFIKKSTCCGEIMKTMIWLPCKRDKMKIEKTLETQLAVSDKIVGELINKSFYLIPDPSVMHKGFFVS